MKLFAYCAESYQRSVRRAAGVQPLTCPPVSLDTFKSSMLNGYDFYYFKLHGLPDEPHWYGDDWTTALSLSQLAEAYLDGATVFVANCYLPDSPMLDGLFMGGARYVVGGAGPNYALAHGVDGADLLGLYFRWMVGLGLRVEYALRLAKTRLRLKYPGQARDDTLDFQLYTRSTYELYRGES